MGQPVEQPVTVLLGGQPAAGKTNAGKLAAEIHAEAHLVQVIGDDYREFHPGYEQVMRDDPLAMPHLTGEASGPWVGMSVEYCRAQGYSLLIEGTWRNEKTVLDGAEQSAQAGRHVHAMIVVVQPEVSRLGARSRPTRESVGAGLPRAVQPHSA